MASISRLNPEKLDTLLPTGPIQSLRQIQAVYGALAEAADERTPPGQEEYSLYFTPDELDPFIATDAEERFLVSVKVDFTGEDPTPEGVEVRPLTAEIAPRLGLVRYPWGRGIDHSITRCGAKGGSSASTVVTYCEECLRRWTNGTGREPAISEVVDEHPDGWLISGLSELGARQDVQEAIKQEVEAKISGEPRVVATVKLKLDPATLHDPPEASDPGWFYPGEVPVFNEAMRGRKTWKLTTKNIDNGASEGTAACMITGEKSTVVGTAEDPFALFTLQHTEKFDDLARQESWRSHPIDADAALLLDAGTGFLDDCRQLRNGLQVYTLPYFTELTPERAEGLYDALSQLDDADLEGKHPMVFLQEAVEELTDEDTAAALRFYVIAIRNDQGDVFVFNEIPDATIYPPRELANAHVDVLTGPIFGPAGFAQPESWRHISETADVNDVVSAIVSGAYARDTVMTSGDEGAMADEPSEWLAFAMLTGETIEREWLLEQYVSRLAEVREQDDENRLSENHLLTQFTQLVALERADMIKTTDRQTTAAMNEFQSTIDDVLAPISESTDIEDLLEDGLPSILEIREYRLRRFLAAREELSQHQERRGAFLIGVLIGQLSTHQRTQRGMNRTFADQHQAEALTLHQIDDLVTRLLDKDRVYASEHDYSRDGSCFPETTERLAETLAGHRPSEWESISLADVRFHLALGVTYGLRAQSRAFDLRGELEAQLTE